MPISEEFQAQVQAINKLSDLEKFTHYKAGDTIDGEGTIERIAFLQGKPSADNATTEGAVVIFFRNGRMGSSFVFDIKNV